MRKGGETISLSAASAASNMTVIKRSQSAARDATALHMALPGQGRKRGGAETAAPMVSHDR
ncbi:hypothetical protein LMG27198_36510 [Methylocystis echinoides]|uniref:Uncharacterized protein n=1 Tax=Methylocystis echinoides TaxID=29468 RepID=A0A9W6LTR2_9HYPH|nr:hypothetical protein LMG27198_36510 [Methylocystis echinoides]